MSRESGFDARLAALQMRFLARAAEDRARIEKNLGCIDDPLARARVLAELRDLSHGLAGAGGTFGYAGVSAAAEAFEARILEDTVETAVVREEAERLIAVLQGL